MSLSMIFPQHPLVRIAASPFIHQRPSPLSDWQEEWQMAEDELAYTVTARVPGIAADGVKVSISEDGLVRLTAADQDGSLVLQKQLLLPQDADPTSLRSWCVDGILRVTLNKLQPPEPTVITVHPQEPPASDSDQEYELVRSLPGISAAEISVELQEDVLSIWAKSTRGHGTYNYRVMVPNDVVQHQVTAFCEHGLLTVKLPKRKVTPIEITIAASEAEIDKDTIHLARFKVPGYGAEDIAISGSPSHLTIKLDKDGQKVQRQVPLPDGLDPAAVNAVCCNGLLTIGYAKSVLRQPSEMEVEVAGNEPMMSLMN